MNPSHGFDRLNILEWFVENLLVLGDHFVDKEADSFGECARETRLSLDEAFLTLWTNLISFLALAFMKL